MKTDEPQLTPAEKSEQARAELLRRLKARNDIVSFAQALDFKPAVHHELILRSFAGMLVDDDCDVLIMLMPPGSAKSTYCAVVAPAWTLLRNPKAEIILACNIAELAQRFGRQVRNTLLGTAWRSLTGTAVEIADDSASAGRWNTNLGGGLYAVGQGGAILGRRADLAILDDLVLSFEQAANPAQLAKIAEWIKSDLLSRLKPGAKIVAIQQRMAYNDPPGFLQRYFEGTGTRVKTLCLPMLAGADDPLGRAPGERLWGEWFTERHVAVAKLDATRWACMYQQEPLQDVGQFFAREWVRTMPRPNLATYSLCVDLATGSSAGDYTVVMPVGTFMHQGQRCLHVGRVLRRRCTVLEAVDLMLELATMYDAHDFVIDGDMLFKSSRELIADRMRQRGRFLHPFVMPLQGQDKATRAGPLRALMSSGRVFFEDGPWLPQLENELELFPLATGPGVDDQVDALALLPRRLLRAGIAIEPLPLRTVDLVGTSLTLTVPATFASAYD